MNPSERTVPLRGGAVRLRVLTAGRGPDLVWFHSFHDRSAWPPLLEALARRFTVHAPFHPGVQGSEGVEVVDDVVDLALAYDELLGALGIAQAHLAGHFFGGMVVAEIASICPGRATKVVLISPLGLWLDAKPVAVEIPSILAASRVVKPAKYHSLTNSALGGSVFASFVSASSSATSLSSVESES